MSVEDGSILRNSTRCFVASNKSRRVIDSDASIRLPGISIARIYECLLSLEGNVFNQEGIFSVLFEGSAEVRARIVAPGYF